MALYTNTVTDSNGTPINGAKIYVYEQTTGKPLAALTNDSGGELANPVTSDTYGVYSFNLPDNWYTLKIHYGGKLQEIYVNEPVGVPEGVLEYMTRAEEAAARAEISELNAQNLASSGMGPGSISSAFVSGDGCRIQPYFLGYKDGGAVTLDPRTSPKATIACYDPGFDTHGIATLKARTIVVTVPHRKDYPDVNVRIETESALGLDTSYWLSEPIYQYSSFGYSLSTLPPFFHASQGVYVDSGSGGSGGTSPDGYRYAYNASTRASPPPLVQWQHSAYERASGASYAVEVMVDHLFAFDKQPVACVEITITDSAGNTAMGRASAMVQSNQTTAVAPVFRAVIDTTALTDGTGTLSVKAKPWIGTEWVSTDSGYSWPTPQICDIPVEIDNAGIYAPAYACLDTAAGNDGTAVVSLTQGTAEASPYLTLAALLTGIKTFNNARGHNDHDAGVVLLTQDISGFGADMTSVLTLSKTWLTFKNKSSVTAKTIGITDTATATNRKVVKLMAFENLWLRSATAGRQLFDGVVDTASAGKPQCYLKFTNCIREGTAGSSTPPLLNVGMWDDINVQIKEGGTSAYKHFGNTRQHWRRAIGCTNSIASTATITGYCWAMTGCDFDYVQMEDVPTSATYSQSPDGMMIQFSKFHKLPSPIDLATSQSYAYGLSFSGNLVEKVTGVNNAFGLGSITTATNIINAVVRNNTIVGERSNIFYCVDYDRTIHEAWQGNLCDQYNCKGDVFAVAARVGNYESRFGVNHSANHYINYPDTTGFGTYGTYENPTSWLGDFNGLGMTVGAASFTLDASFRGTAAGRGTYTLTSATGIARIPMGRAAYPFDLEGNPYANDGTYLAHCRRTASLLSRGIKAAISGVPLGRRSRTSSRSGFAPEISPVQSICQPQASATAILISSSFIVSNFLRSCGGQKGRG